MPSSCRDPHRVVAELLAKHPRGLPDRAIRRRIGLRGPDTCRILAGLQQQGLVEKAGGRWRWLEREPRRLCGSGTENSKERTAHAPPPHGFDVLRRICAFHAEAAKELASSKLSLEPGDARLRMEVTAPIDWFLLAHDGVEIPRDALPFTSWRSQDQRIVFCGPLHLVELPRRKRGIDRVWLPIFLIHTKPKRLPQEIGFTLEGSVQVNLDWLDALFSSAEEDLKDDLLIQLGFLEEDDSGVPRPLEVRDLSKCWEALQTRIRDWPWPEERSLRKPSRPRDLSEVREPGIYPRILAFEEDLSSYSKGLVEDLRAIAKATDTELAQTALVSLLPGEFPDLPAPSALEGAAVAQVAALNPEQRQVVEEALTELLAVVQGPPGTGKSTVVRSALLSLGVNGGSCVFASRNHRAVDAVAHPLDLGEDEPCLVADLRTRERNTHWVGLLVGNLDAPPPEDPVDLADLRERIAALEAETEERAHALSRVYQGRDELALVNQRLRELTEEGAEWEGAARDVRLEGGPEEILWLCGFGRLPWWHPRRLLSLPRRRRVLAKARGGPHGDRMHRLEDLVIVARWQACYLRRDELEAMLQRIPSPTELGEAMFGGLAAQVDVVLESLPALPSAWADRVRSRPDLLLPMRNEQHSGRGARGSRRRLDALAREHFEELLPGLPLWVITNLSVNRQVPRVAGAFDLAVIDEAGQCDPASVLPLLFRARRALFVGDPQQLRPVGSLGLAREEALRRKHGIQDQAFTRFAHSGRSAYDLAHDALIIQGRRPILLREHFRCHPAIAEFFSREFYGGKLVLRTSALNLDDGAGGIRWTHVPGGSTTVNGSRWHPPQVEAIVEELANLAQRGFDGCVGVVTPFREHAKRIRDAAYRLLGPKCLESWAFVADTADGFQGGEKDVILFGLVGGGDEENATPHFYKRDLNRFNVAVSRAKLLLHVFGDLDWAQGCGIPVLQHLAAAADCCRETREEEVRWDLVGPVWEPKLAEALHQAGIEFRQQYPTCGFYLDFAIFLRDGRKLNIEVDGETYHRDRDGNLRAEDLRRDLILRANGWAVQRFWVYELREDIDQCLHQIKELMKNL